MTLLKQPYDLWKPLQALGAPAIWLLDAAHYAILTLPLQQLVAITKLPLRLDDLIRPELEIDSAATFLFHPNKRAFAISSGRLVEQLCVLDECSPRSRPSPAPDHIERTVRCLRHRLLMDEFLQTLPPHQHDLVGGLASRKTASRNVTLHSAFKPFVQSQVDGCRAPEAPSSKS